MRISLIKLFILVLFIYKCSSVSDPTGLSDDSYKKRLERMTSRTYTGNHNNIFHASVEAIEESGYMLKTTSMDTGLVAATYNKGYSAFETALQCLPSITFMLIPRIIANKISPNVLELTARIKQVSEDESKVILDLRSGDGSKILLEDSYNEIFEKIGSNLHLNRRFQTKRMNNSQNTYSEYRNKYSQKNSQRLVPRLPTPSCCKK